MARPIVALARKPGPKSPDPAWSPMARAYGPVTIDQRRHRMGGRLHAVQIERRVQHGLHGRDDGRESTLG